MSVSPQGLSIQSLYRSYRNGELQVNRQYQRKLVWFVSEKQELIDSIFNDYPLPLFLFAERKSPDGRVILEVIDGIQRLNAIFGFIENSFNWKEQCFDVKEFARARQAADEKLFTVFPSEVKRISSQECANYLDYNLAVTIFPGEKAERITDVFRRINSGGRQLSDQERRQAGVLSPFAEVIRTLGAEIRGDVSRETLSLYEMPEISIETTRNPHGYSLKAEDTFWCFQGVLRTGDLRASEDERVLADICASIVCEYPIMSSGEYLDKIYDKTTKEYAEINQKLNSYGIDRLKHEVKIVISMIKTSIEEYSSTRYAFRDLVYPTATSNSQKTPFYATFMAFHNLVFKKGLLPPRGGAYLNSIKDLSEKLSKLRSEKERAKNINLTCGLLEPNFIKDDKASLGHGPGLNIDFENSIRRSKTESMRYEYKQGLYRLADSRDFDDGILKVIIETICGIANVGPDGKGYIYIGIADKTADAERISTLDGVTPVYVPGAESIALVGIDRELKLANCNFDNYLNKITNFIQKSKISDSLKTDVLSSIDIINYKGLSILRLLIPAQKQVSFVGEECFFRQGSSTLKATGPQIASISAKF